MNKSFETRNKKSIKIRTKKYVKDVFSFNMLKKRLPIIQWLPRYKSEYIIQDIIAGITVGLTAIPQGIAFAILAGLPPEHGLYASLTSGIVYVFFGSCYNVTVGPTAILAAMTARYVADYSADFAIFTAFVSGSFILLLGILNLGFLVEFISKPVIIGFMNAAALQIASSQLKSCFGLDGSSGSYFMESMYNFFSNIHTIKLWDTILAISSIAMLFLLKKMGEGKRTDKIFSQAKWFISLSRNAFVVILGMLISYTFKRLFDMEPVIIIGEIGEGLPKFTWPPFSTVVGNETIGFTEMVQILGAQAIVIPFVAILETVAIGKAFAANGRIDATQEMIAIGLCNIIGSFGQSMPITGSFARTALNHVSGVKTPAGGVTKVLILVFALTYLTSTFYYIPKASLSAILITALFSMMEYRIFIALWKNSKKELFLLTITMIICLSFGLEYGIITGILSQAILLLYNTARPTVDVNKIKSEKGDLIVFNLCENLLYCASEYVRGIIVNTSFEDLNNVTIIFDATNLKKLDYTAAINLMSAVSDLSKSHAIHLLNFNADLKKLCTNIDSRFENNFSQGSTPGVTTETLRNDGRSVF